MSVKITVTASGPLFDNPTKNLRESVEEALDLTSDFGKGILRDISPVRTGNLKAGWDVEREDYSSYLINNAVDYTIFVDKKIEMVKRAQSQIDEFQSLALEDAIDRTFN
ncbi:MAG: hypothetical protein KME13_18505 [Myxacorys californica WJT36-NPBG1]|jgi:hypothetical protein|nr:hypothetical protein [Myxacorys californica WJT36-NPBG1]